MNFESLSRHAEFAGRLHFLEAPPSSLAAMNRHACALGLPTCAYVHSRELHGTFDSFVTESVCFLIAIPDQFVLDWRKLVADWLVPHAEVDYLGRCARALISIGDSPLAVATSAMAPALFAAQDVFVIFTTSKGALAVKYRWNEKLLACVASADMAARQYQHRVDEAERMISSGWPVYGCDRKPAIVAAPVQFDEAGTIRSWQPDQWSPSSVTDATRVRRAMQAFEAVLAGGLSSAVCLTRKG